MSGRLYARKEQGHGSDHHQSTRYRQLESAVAEWLHATRRLALTVARAAWEKLIMTSRAALLVENGSRQRRRF
jgi:hypothetical protein